MIGNSNLFSDIICPYDEGCARPYCQFWHSKDESLSRQNGYTASISATQSGPSFIGYVGYVGNETAQIASDYSSYQSTAGYIGSVASTSSSVSLDTDYNALVVNNDSTVKARLRRRIPSPDQSLAKPKLPVELSVNEILDPSMDKPVEKVDEAAPPKKELKLHDYVKSVAIIDTQIEELQRALEKQKKEKEKMISEFKAKAKNGADYASSKKNALKYQRKQAPATSKLPAYSGGYTPTPIAVLKSKAEKKEKVLDSPPEDDRSQTTVQAVNAKEPLEKRYSIDDLFEDEPSAKRARKDSSEQDTKKKQGYIWKNPKEASKTEGIDKAMSSTTKLDLRARNGPRGGLTAEQIKAAKKRTAPPTSQPYFQKQSIPTKKTVPNVAQQLFYRYERLQKEKEEIMKKVQEKTGQPPKAKGFAEDNFGNEASGSGSIAKGEKRIAHAASVTKQGAGKLMPLDPFACGKVPYTLRMRYLSLFHAEFIKLGDSSTEALVQKHVRRSRIPVRHKQAKQALGKGKRVSKQEAQQEEKALKDKAITKGGYTCSAVNVLRRLREATSGVLSSVETKSVSHAAVLEGKHHGSITVGKRKHVALSSRELSESSFYEALIEKFVLSPEQLEKNGYPLWKDNEKKMVKVLASERDARKKMFVASNDLKRICCRCGAEFRLNADLEYASNEPCVYHWGRAYKTRTQGSWESKYSCCGSDLSVKGCCVADFHVTDSACISELQTFIETPPPSGTSDSRSRRVYALDCEMVYTTRGLCLARISAVDMKDALVLDVLVRPRYTIIDANTRFSGLTKEQLEKAEYSFEEARKRLFELVNADTVLIGHSLESDLKAMRIVHHKVVDTSVVYPHRLGPPFKRALKTIAAEVLQLIIQEDVAGHDSKEDASACMRLMLNKVKQT